MPDDVPVDQPPQRVTEPAAWERWYWLWDAYIGIAYAAVLVVLFTAGIRTGELVVATGSLTATIALYVFLGRRVIRTDQLTPYRWWFATGLLAFFIAAILAQPTSSFALFWLCPMLFMALPTRAAALLLVVVNLLPATATVLRDGDVGEVFVQLGPVIAMALLLSVFLGIWIERIMNQSARRGELIDQLQASRAEVARLSHEAGVSAERARLAGEIHDTLAQGFTSIVTLVQAAESEIDSDAPQARQHLALAARTARENLAESRALVAALTPFALTDGPLEDAVRRQVERLAQETAVQAVYHRVGDAHPLPTAVEVVLLRTAQEALTNVRRHAGATAVRVELAFGESSVRLHVCDDGTGYDPTAPSNGFGLRGMRARVEQVHGTLSVRGEPGRGTTLELEVPR